MAEDGVITGDTRVLAQGLDLEKGTIDETALLAALGLGLVTVTVHRETLVQLMFSCCMTFQPRTRRLLPIL